MKKVEDIAIEKKERAKGLVLRRSRDVFLDSEMGWKRLHFGSTRLAWMAFIVKQDEPLDPMDVNFLSAPRVLLHTQQYTNPIE